ncbi:MAG: DUF3052 domain-containing protein [Acidimicrobiales bacterium]|nr:DUF3052 domain-containing protein [Acidimicrobiales bacterium]
MVAGYSGTPLAKKLGMKENHRVCLLGEPDGFRDQLLDTPPGVSFFTRLPKDPDVVIAFATERRRLEEMIVKSSQPIFPDGSLWAAWPKKASKVPTDITEDTVREIALPIGLVDNKVCAIDATWSGLRVVWRKELRSR